MASRTGTTTGLSIDIVHALHHLHPTHFVGQMGYPCNVGAEYVATNGFFPTIDGTYVMIEAGRPTPSCRMDTCSSSIARTPKRR
jgi:hypothetical protein